jgi:hypothetical protein
MDLKHRSRGITGGRDRVPARSMFKANRRLHDGDMIRFDVSQAS